MKQLENLIDDLERALLSLNRNEAGMILQKAVQYGSPIDVASELVVKTLERIGNAWEEGQVALSQVYMSGVICEELVDRILPPQSPVRKDQPPMGIAVFEDFHLLGKRIIYSSLRASGFELIDLGNGLKSQDVIELVDKHKIKILLLSVLMLPSALRIKNLSAQLNERNVKLIVGGAPFRFDQNLWKEIGADATGKNPTEALEIIHEMMGGKL